mmetsp:Transcript_39080/g.67032  ORF Transcript_39080/g.67032 Transcript_39080/m.67032 type:complete len:242 (-) Transcript_39080:60-785(-)
MSDIESLQKLKVVELKKQLKEKGLSTTGKKDQLVQLLHEALTAETKSEEPTTTTKKKEQVEKEVKKTKATSSSSSEKTKDQLNRVTRLGLPVKSTNTTEEITHTKIEAPVDPKEVRRKRFGDEAFLSESEITKKKREERFGPVVNQSSQESSKNGSKKRPRSAIESKDSDPLSEAKRRRLERFGPPTDNPLDNQAIELRKARFGDVTTEKKQKPNSTFNSHKKKNPQRNKGKQGKNWYRRK